MARHALIGLFAGGVIGAVVLGVGGRLVMRVVVIMAGGSAGFSVGGTLEVVTFGVLVGAVAGVGYLALRHVIPGHPALKGLIFGVLVYGALLLIPFESKNAAAGFPDLLGAIVLMFGVLMVVFGTLLSLTIERLVDEHSDRNA